MQGSEATSLELPFVQRPILPHPIKAASLSQLARYHFQLISAPASIIHENADPMLAAHFPLATIGPDLYSHGQAVNDKTKTHKGTSRSNDTNPFQSTHLHTPTFQSTPAQTDTQTYISISIVYKKCVYTYHRSPKQLYHVHIAAMSVINSKQ